MVNSPREIVGAVLKYMGASYNAKDMDSEVDGGRIAVEKNLALLVKQVFISIECDFNLFLYMLLNSTISLRKDEKR